MVGAAGQAAWPIMLAPLTNLAKAGTDTGGLMNRQPLTQGE